MWCSPRRFGHDDTRGYHHGDIERSHAGNEGSGSKNRPLRTAGEMTKQEVAKRVAQIGIVPVVRAASAKQGMLAAEAVCKGGITVVEMTMTVPGAIEAISQLVKSMGSEVLIGAGTVTDAETA